MGQASVGEFMDDMYGFFKSYRYLYLKKLSTGSDETEHNKKQILGLNELIERREKEVARIRDELKNLKVSRVENNRLKRAEIEGLKEKLRGVDQHKARRMGQMKQKNEDQYRTNMKVHSEKVGLR